MKRNWRIILSLYSIASSVVSMFIIKILSIFIISDSPFLWLGNFFVYKTSKNTHINSNTQMGTQNAIAFMQTNLQSSKLLIILKIYGGFLFSFFFLSWTNYSTVNKEMFLKSSFFLPLHPPNRLALWVFLSFTHHEKTLYNRTRDVKQSALLNLTNFFHICCFPRFRDWYLYPLA